ncbi:MAG: Mrp/NBP35 family ATP-binding protein [Anaerolineae bacterium]|nr:Mrp/NBP35 family ATP-binding protein [Anaerolineae bacterium]
MSNDNAQRQAAMAALHTVNDPELHRDIITLNMVRDLEIDDAGVARFRLVLTTPACPLKHVFEAECRKALVGPVEGITDVAITWDSEMPTDSRLHGRLDTKMRSIIAVSSGKGGVGKSTVSVNLAVALAQNGARVGLMDADILGPNLPMMVGLGFGRPRVTPDGKLIPYEAYGLQVMSMGFLVEPGKPLVWRGPMLHGAIRQFFNDVMWDQVDYMIVDLPPGTGDAQLSLAQSVPLTGVVIVTQPQAVATDDALKGLAMFEELNVPILGVVENMTGEFFGEGGGEKLAQQRNVPFLGRIPMDAQVRLGGDNGKPVVMEKPDSPAAVAFQEVAKTVAGQVSIAILEQRDVIPLNIVS